MADVGTENYDQEFTLGLIENEQGTLEQVNEALDGSSTGRTAGARNATSRSPSRGSRPCPTRGIAFDVHGSWRVANEAATGACDPSRWLLFWSHRPGRAGLRPGDQVDGLRPDRPAARSRRSRSIPNILELHTSYNTGALWGFGRDLPVQQPDLRRRSRSSPRSSICYWLFVLGAATEPRLTDRAGPDHGRGPGQLLRPPGLRPRPRLRPLPRRPDRLRLRDLQFRRQHAGRRRHRP